ncbi:hypothetical protein Va3_019 [Vibrio phage Va3]|nr:hypothetical protein Va3_019 [Vibrio phage Va3]
MNSTEAKLNSIANELATSLRELNAKLKSGIQREEPYMGFGLAIGSLVNKVLHDSKNDGSGFVSLAHKYTRDNAIKSDLSFTTVMYRNSGMKSTELLVNVVAFYHQVFNVANTKQLERIYIETMNLIEDTKEMHSDIKNSRDNAVTERNKSSAIAEQNQQVEIIINQVLSTLDKELAAVYRRHLDRADNKLQLLKRLMNQ